MSINMSDYGCLECGLWGDLLLGYGVLNGREDGLGVDSEILEREKEFILRTYNNYLEFRKSNGGHPVVLEPEESFDDLSKMVRGKLDTCVNCQEVYQRHYLTGKNLALSSQK